MWCHRVVGVVLNSIHEYIILSSYIKQCISSFLNLSSRMKFKHWKTSGKLYFKISLFKKINAFLDLKSKLFHHAVIFIKNSSSDSSIFHKFDEGNGSSTEIWNFPTFILILAYKVKLPPSSIKFTQNEIYLSKYGICSNFYFSSTPKKKKIMLWQPESQSILF